MSTRSSMYARAGLVALVLAAAACQRPEEKTSKKKDHGIMLIAHQKGNGKWKADALPEKKSIRPYDPDSHEIQHHVVWVFAHASTTIRFLETAVIKEQPTCTDGVCHWDVPVGLKPKHPYEYIVEGEYEPGNPLDPKDPFIEVDR